ncbi:hypothetical protein Cni_G04778 [Canna indica]|uniref:Myb-like domain-containing protein n=1 Tax=Canna indica TaxID=4628 RepID=A0AAQ3JWH9_9LILI|nr:hypothetical protein Cni_G04778 [Canna indica]
MPHMAKQVMLNSWPPPSAAAAENLHNYRSLISETQFSPMLLALNGLKLAALYMTCNAFASSGSRALYINPTLLFQIVSKPNQSALLSSAAAAPTALSEMECHGRSCSSTTPPSEEEMDLRRGPWTVDEDLMLMNYVTAHGEGRWNSLARCAGGYDLLSTLLSCFWLSIIDWMFMELTGCDRSEANREELPAPVAQLPPPRRSARQHHAGGATPHPRTPFPLGEPVVEDSAALAGADRQRDQELLADARAEAREAAALRREQQAVQGHHALHMDAAPRRADPRGGRRRRRGHASRYRGSGGQYSHASGCGPPPASRHRCRVRRAAERELLGALLLLLGRVRRDDDAALVAAGLRRELPRAGGRQRRLDEAGGTAAEPGRVRVRRRAAGFRAGRVGRELVERGGHLAATAALKQITTSKTI